MYPGEFARLVSFVIHNFDTYRFDIIQSRKTRIPTSKLLKKLIFKIFLNTTYSILTKSYIDIHIVHRKYLDIEFMFFIKTLKN